MITIQKHHTIKCDDVPNVDHLTHINTSMFLTKCTWQKTTVLSAKYAIPTPVSIACRKTTLHSPTLLFKELAWMVEVELATW